MYEPTWRKIPEKRIGYSAAKWLCAVTCCFATGLVMYGIADASTDEPVDLDICKEAFVYEPTDRVQPRKVSEAPRRTRAKAQLVTVSKETPRGSEGEEAVHDIPEEPGSEGEEEDGGEDSGETWVDAEPVYDIYWDGDDGSEYYEPVYEEVYGEEIDGAEDDGDDIGASGYYTADEFRFDGRVYDGDHEYTWYSEQVLPGGGLDIPGRHVDEDGYVRDGDGNLCVASNGYSYGEQIEVPFGDGTAVVYDSCEGEGDELVDVYVSW